MVNTGNQLVVTLPESITFDTGSAIVHADYADEIALVARSLRDNPNSTVLVVGHTDNVGATAYNQALSERRAGAVAAILTSNGVAAPASAPSAAATTSRSPATTRPAAAPRTAASRSSSPRPRARKPGLALFR